MAITAHGESILMQGIRSTHYWDRGLRSDKMGIRDLHVEELDGERRGYRCRLRGGRHTDYLSGRWRSWLWRLDGRGMAHLLGHRGRLLGRLRWVLGGMFPVKFLKTSNESCLVASSTPLHVSDTLREPFRGAAKLTGAVRAFLLPS